MFLHLCEDLKGLREDFHFYICSLSLSHTVLSLFQILRLAERFKLLLETKRKWLYILNLGLETWYLFFYHTFDFNLGPLMFWVNGDKITRGRIKHFVKYTLILLEIFSFLLSLSFWFHCNNLFCIVNLFIFFPSNSIFLKRN